MGKHDHPSLQFVVENGRLAPAGPWEAEVLSTYQLGAQLTVTLNQRRSLPLLRKYFAVLRDVVENCKTPWNSADEASDALKLALGVTDISKMVGGQWFIRPGSISFTSMDEAAFRDYFEKAMAILAKVTGIDPDTLRGRYSHLPETDNPQSSDTPSPSDENGSDRAPPPPESSVAAYLSEPAGGGPAEEGAIASETASKAGHGGQSAPSSGLSDELRGRLLLLEECADAMFGAATHLNAAEREDRLDKVRMACLADMAEDEGFVDMAYRTCGRLIKNPAGRDQAMPYLKGLARKWIGVA